MNKTELKAAAARLLYNSNRSTSDYDMLIDFIDSHFDNQPAAYSVEAVVRELEEKRVTAFLTLANTGDESLDKAWVYVFTYLDAAIEIVKRGGRDE